MPPLSRPPLPLYQSSSHLWFSDRPFWPPLPGAPSCGSPCARGTESRVPVPALTCRRSRRGGGAGSGPRWVRGGWASVGAGGGGAAARERAPATHFPSGSRRLPPGKGLSLTRTSAPAQDLGLRILVFGLAAPDAALEHDSANEFLDSPGPRAFQAVGGLFRNDPAREDNL